MAELGNTVVAVELAPPRVEQARELASQHSNLQVVEADFYIVELTGQFDIVCYWDGFGMGTDGDQRRLLRRVAREWLSEDGKMLVDVYLPSAWAARAGEEELLRSIRRYVEGEVRTVDLDVPLKRRYDFDPVTSRVSIELWPLRTRKEAIKQWVRCYAPTDLLLLLEGTGLRADLFEVDSKQFHIKDGDHNMSGPLGDTERYLVKLVYESSDDAAQAIS